MQVKDHITCYKCNEIGLFSNECTKYTEPGKQFLNNGENNNQEDDDYDDEDECGDFKFTNILCKQSSNVVSTN